MVVRTIGHLSGPRLFYYPLLRPRLDTTIIALIPLGITMIITKGVIEFGFQDIGNIEERPTVGREFGFEATGNGAKGLQDALTIEKRKTA